MRINAHAHIFNLQTVLTREAIEIMARRLRDRGVPDYVVGAVTRILDRQLDHPEYLVEEELLERFLSEIATHPSFQALLANTAVALPVEIAVLGGGVRDLGVSALRSTLDRLSTHLDAKDGVGGGIFDVFETLRLAMQPDIVSVADRLLEHLRPCDGLIALMMDISSESDPERDRRNFERQHRGTSETAVQRPGRIFPVWLHAELNAYRDAGVEPAVEASGADGGTRIALAAAYRFLGERRRVPDELFLRWTDGETPTLPARRKAWMFGIVLHRNATAQVDAPAWLGRSTPVHLQPLVYS